VRNVQRVGNPTVAEMREGWEKFAGQFPPAKDLRFEPVDAGGVPAEWSRAPGIDDSRVVLFFHGCRY
jgi:hypothetical protein